MVYSDNFAEGIGLLILLMAGLTFVLVVMEMPILYWILKRTQDQSLRRAILAIALGPGLVLALSSFIDSGGPAMVFLSLLFIGPVAALVPPFVFPDMTGPGTRFRQILFVYFSIIVFEIFLAVRICSAENIPGPLAAPGSAGFRCHNLCRPCHP